MADTVTLQTVLDEIKLLRKDLRKVKNLIEDPNGEKAKARSTSNGFNKPLDISEELRKFLKLAAGEQISRSQVTKKVNEYVTEKGLKQGQNINKHYIKSETAKPKKEKATNPTTAETPKPAAAKRPTVKKV